MAVQFNFGDAVLNITGEFAGLNKALKGAKLAVNKNMGEINALIKGMGKAMAGAGAAITAGFGLALHSVEQFGSAIHDLALKTGASTELLSGLKYAAEQTGTTIDAVAIAFKKMQKTIGSGTAEEGAPAGGGHSAIAQLGIDMAQLKSLNPNQQFLTLADALRKVGAGTAQAALAQQIFGRSATDILPMINDEKMSVDQFIAKAEKLGLVLSQDAANSADAFGDALKDLKDSFRGVMEKAITPILPLLTKFLDMAVNGVVAIKDWVVSHKELAKQIVVGVAGLGLLLTGLGGLMLLLPTIVSSVGLLIAAFSALWLPITLAVSAISAFAYAWKENLGGIRDWLMPFLENMELVFRGGWKRIWDGILLDLKITINLMEQAWAKFRAGDKEHYQRQEMELQEKLNSARAPGASSAQKASIPFLVALLANAQAGAKNSTADNGPLKALQDEYNNLTGQKTQLNAEKLKAIGGKTWIEQAVDGVKGLIEWFKKAGTENDKLKGKFSGGSSIGPLEPGGIFLAMANMNRTVRGNGNFLDARQRKWSEIADMNFGRSRSHQSTILGGMAKSADVRSNEAVVKENERNLQAYAIARELRKVFQPVDGQAMVGLLKITADSLGY